MQTIPETKYKFAERLRYGGVWEHDCWHNGRFFKVYLGDESFESLRPYYNGTPLEFESDVASRLNLLSLSNQEAASKELVDAFNIWRAEKHAERVNRILSQPDRYGVIEPSDPFLKAPPVVYPGYYKQGVGWVKQD